ncbi:MAG: ribbon-helix-helix protein, CopG family [Cyanobacteria bacterium SIG30]|nr:ribbon-helix-helix protein, CopG family [Cyanobacteria bacterium SIG30]
MARILVSIPDDFLSSVDKCAADKMRSRSRFIREALQLYIKRSSFANSKKREEDAKILDEILA